MLRKLAGQTLIYGLSTIIPRLINYLLTPYLTYIALNNNEYGVMGYFYATIPFGLSLLTMGMESGYFRFTGKCESDKEKTTVFNTTFSFVIALSSIFFLATLLFQDSIFNIINQDFAISIIPMVGGIIALDAIASIPFARLREQQRSLKFVYIKAISVLINICLVLLFYSVLPKLKDFPIFSWMLVENFGCGYVFVANIISSTLSLIILLFLCKDFRFKINRKMLRSILLFSIPLFISGFSATANEFIDRQMLAVMVPYSESMYEIGIYSATLKIAGLMVIFTQMYRYAAEPLFLSKLKNREFTDGNAEAMKFFTIVSIIIFLGITLFIDIFEKFVAPSFREGISLIPIILISNILLGIYLNLSFWYKYIEKTYFAIIITAIGLAINILVNYIYIPTFGYEASVWAKFISVFAMVSVSYFLNQKYYPIPYNVKRMAEYVIVAAIIYYIGKNISLQNIIIDNIFNSILLLLFIAFGIYREKILSKIKKH